MLTNDQKILADRIEFAIKQLGIPCARWTADDVGVVILNPSNGYCVTLDARGTLLPGQIVIERNVGGNPCR